MTRADLEAAVEHGIALLDAWDGDSDFEVDCDDDAASEDEGHDSDTETPLDMGGGPMIPANLTPEQAEAIDELFHQCDLIATRPLPCEIEWALRKSYGRHMVPT